METKVLLSIKPEYVEKLLSGEKKFEYRRVIFKKDVKTVLIYSTSPIKKIIGEFEINEILRENPSKLWTLTKEFSGIEKNKFFKYFDGIENGYAIGIKSIKIYKNPLVLSDINIKMAPQSFRYVNINKVD